MSAEMPWYKAYPRDFFDAVIGWPVEKKGAYRLLLDLIYMYEGRVPDDAAFMVSNLGLSSKRKWSALRDWLISEGKIAVDEGYITNYRASIEILSARERGKKRFDKKHKSNENNDVKNTDTDTDKTPNPLKGELSFEVFWEAIPQDQRIAPDRAQRNWDKLDPADRQAAIAALPAHIAKTKSGTHRPPSPSTYLRDKWFQRYAGGPVIAVPDEGTAARVLFDVLTAAHPANVYQNFFDGAQIDGQVVRIADERRFDRATGYRDTLATAGFTLEQVA